MNSSDLSSANLPLKSRTAKAIPPFSSSRERYDRVKVQDTARCGLGVFALAPIKRGHAVGRVLGEPKPKEFRSDYCVEFGDSVLEPFEPYRFLNHSCSPNCQFIEWHIDDGENARDRSEPTLELWLHTLRDILPGEELTIDYGWDWQSAIPCMCGSANCRGWVCKEEELEQCIAFHANNDVNNRNDASKIEF